MFSTSEFSIEIERMEKENMEKEIRNLSEDYGIPIDNKNLLKTARFSRSFVLV